MQVYTCTKFKGHYPVGAAAVIVAPTRAHAVDMINRKLEEIGLPQYVLMDDVELVDKNIPQTIIMCDGNY